MNSCTPTSTITSALTRALTARVERLGHLGEIEPIEVVEVDRVVAVDIAERFVDQDRFGRHLRGLERGHVDGVAEEHDGVALDRAVLDAGDVDFVGLARFGRCGWPRPRPSALQGDGLSCADRPGDRGGRRREADEQRPIIPRYRARPVRYRCHRTGPRGWRGR